MVVRLLDGSCGRDLNAAVIAAAFRNGCLPHESNPWVYFYIFEWSKFLHIVWMAFSEYSRTNTLSSKNSKIPVKVMTDDGREFHTEVWFDDEYKGLRYVSLYR